MKHRSSSTQGCSICSLLLPSSDMLILIDGARRTAHIVLVSSHHTSAQSSRQAHWNTEILPHYTDIPHFKFNKFKHMCLSFQSPVSPFPQGTSSLLVSKCSTALDEDYHHFVRRCQGAQLVNCTPCAGVWQPLHRVFTLFDALFREPAAASPLVAHCKTTTQDHASKFPLRVCPCAFATTTGVLIGLL